MKNLSAAVPQAVTDLLEKIIHNIINPFVVILFALAFLFFSWSVFRYIRSADDATERQKAGKGILYGILGMFIMISVFGLMNIINGTITSF